jgi:hypothetical protein
MTKGFPMHRALTAALLTGVLALASCATPTPYQPLMPHGVSSGGYSDLKISSDRYRITFEGNSATERDTVERYLLYHAAEVTLREGYDWFMLANRRTDEKTSHFITPDPAFGAWQPEWLYRGRGRWALVPSYDPFWGGGFYQTDDVSRYKANAEILLGHGKKPADNPAAFDAHEVSANLAPTIARPKP